MSITVNGHVHRTLEQPIYLGDGRQVKEAYCNGSKVYPDDIPKGRYVLMLSGGLVTSFQYAREIKYSLAGFLADWPEYELMLGTAQMTSSVTVTVVSERPIALFRQDVAWTTDAGSYYYSGQTLYDKRKHTGPPPKGAKLITVQPFPRVVSSYGFYSAAGECTATGDLSTCQNDTHVRVVASGSNSASPRKYFPGSNWVDYLRLDDPVAEMTYRMGQLGEYGKGYHDTWNTTTQGRSYASSREATFTYTVDGAPRPTSRNAICGYDLYVVVPSIRSGFGMEAYHTSSGYFFAYAPLTDVVYNNNPPVTSRTFSTDPPTEEVPDSIYETL